MAALSLLYVLICTAIGPSLLATIFGSRWQTSGEYVRILAPMFFSQAVASPTGGILDVLKRQDLHLSREVGRLVLLAVAAGITLYVHLTATQAIMVISATVTVCYVWYAITGYLAIRNYTERLIGLQHSN